MLSGNFNYRQGGIITVVDQISVYYKKITFIAVLGITIFNINIFIYITVIKYYFITVIIKIWFILDFGGFVLIKGLILC